MNLLKLPPVGIYLLAIVAGASLTLAFAPWQWWPLAILSPAALIYLLQPAHCDRPFLSGYCYGLGFYGCSVSWIYISIHTYGDTYALVAFLLTALFVAYLAFFPGIFAWLLQRSLKRYSTTANLLFIPVLWVLLEWLRGHLLSGFPWLFVGYAAIDTGLAGFVPLLGVYGLSALWLVLAGLVALSPRLPKPKLACYASLSFAITLVGLYLNNLTWTTPLPSTRSVTLVQANIPQDLKWLSANQQTIIDTYMRLSASAWQNDLVVWSEAAITVPLPFAQPLLKQLQSFTQTHHNTLITGIPALGENEGSYYNLLIALDKPAISSYAKRHLVPFGEYVPLESWLRGLIGFFDLPMSSFIAGHSTASHLSAVGLRFQTGICYEIAFPELMLAGSANSNALLTVSNDTWFGHSLGPKQHFQIARYRALELGLPLLRATNNGITAFVDQQGHVVKEARPFVATVLHGQLTGRTGQTPLLTWGHQGVLTLFVLLAIATLLQQHRKRR